MLVASSMQLTLSQCTNMYWFFTHLKSAPTKVNTLFLKTIISILSVGLSQLFTIGLDHCYQKDRQLGDNQVFLHLLIVKIIIDYLSNNINFYNLTLNFKIKRNFSMSCIIAGDNFVPACILLAID